MLKARSASARVQDGRNREEVVAGVIKLLNKLKPASEIIPRGGKVVIKPNVTAADFLWERGILTNPYTVEGVVRYAMQGYPSQVIIAEATAVGLDTKQGFMNNGYLEVAQRTGAGLLDLNDDEEITLPVVKGLVTNEIKVFKTAVGADLLINIPVMKTHVATGVSLGMKNFKGIIPPAEKRRSHFLGVNEFVADLNSVIKPGLTVIDGTIAMEGDGPMAGTPVNLGLLLASTDLITADMVSSRVMGFEPAEIKLFNLIQERKGVSLPRIEKIEILGPSLKTIERPFIRAEKYVDYPDRVFVINGGACQGCTQSLRMALERLSRAELLEKLPPVTIALGRDASVPLPDALVIGRCLLNHESMAHYVPGCPPQVFLIADELREICGEQRLFGSKDEYLPKGGRQE